MTMNPIRLRAAIALAAMLLTVPLFATQEAVLARGFQANQVYDFTDVDAVNMFNGNLTFTVPLGREYKTNGSLSYAFRLVYNSKVWDYKGGAWSRLPSGEFHDIPPFSPADSMLDGCRDPVSGMESYPAPEFNAGFGWLLTLGELRNTDGVYRYIAPDGAEHRFVSRTLHRDEDPAFPSEPKIFTRDGSYLRLRHIDPVTRVIDFPDGTRRKFVCATANCDADGPVRWLLRQITDPFGNIVSIDRNTASPTAGQPWIWTIRESFVDTARHADADVDGATLAANEVRHHVLTFAFHDMASHGGVTGRQLVLTSVDLSGPGNARAVYDLVQTPTTIYRETRGWWDRAGQVYPLDADKKVPVYLLESVAQPAGAGTWSFEYFTGDEEACPPGEPCPRGKLHAGTGKTTVSFGKSTCDNMRTITTSYVSGRLRKATFPTQGAVEYRYNVRALPLRYCFNTVPVVAFSNVGVGARWTLSAPDAATHEGEWIYDTMANAQFPEWPAQTDFNQGCRPPRELASAVVDPHGTVLLSYFSVYTSGVTTSNDGSLAEQGWSRAEHGLPFSREERDAGGRFISTRTYDCSANRAGAIDEILRGGYNPGSAIWGRQTAQPLCGAPKQETWIRYEATGEDCRAVGDCTLGNPRVASERRIFPDDGAFSYDIDRADFDGLGNHRQVTTSGRGFTDSKTTTTRYNPDVTFAGTNVTVGTDSDWVRTTGPWLLGLYDKQSVREGPHQIDAYFRFHAATGFLERKRLVGASPDPQGDVPIAGTDVLVDFTRTFDPDTGSVTIEERYFGGDQKRNAPMGGPLAAPSASDVPEYHIARRHVAGALAEAWYQKPGCSIREVTIESNAVDPGMGLVTSSVNAAGELTSYTYDALGRLTVVAPQGSSNTALVAKTFYGYATNVAGFGGRVTEVVGDSLEDPAPERTRIHLYDHAGRIREERTLMPNGTSRVVSEYDGLGRKRSQSVLVPLNVAPDFTRWTRDALGRTTREVRWDGGVTTFEHTGGRVVVEESEDVAVTEASGAASSRSRRTFTRDRHERLVEVKESSAAGADVATSYTYDAGDRLIRVDVPAAAGHAAQRRIFTYDNRGFLAAEIHPEIVGLSAEYELDSRGNLRRRQLLPNGLAVAPPAEIAPFERQRFGLRYDYDAAERLVRVAAMKLRDGDASETTLETFSYQPPNGTPNANLSLNKVNVAVRHNWVPDPWKTGALIDVPVTEQFFYDSQTGRMTAKTIRMQDALARTELQYNAAGDVQKIIYPDLTCASCAAMTRRPVAAVDFTWSLGFLTAIPRYASSIHYHRNGMWKDVQHLQAGGANGALDEQLIEMNGSIPHPRIDLLRTTFLVGAPWTHGTFQYDGAGNVTAIGNRSYRYDKVGRLSRSNESGVETAYRYDHHGNLRELGSDAFTVDGRTNRVQSSSTAATGAETWTYDAAGNVTRIGDVAFDYDPLGKQTRVTAPDFGRVFLYDASGERVAVIDYKASPVRWDWTVRGPGNEVLTEFSLANDTWTWTRDYVYRGRTPLAVESMEGGQFTRRSLHADHLGSIRREAGGPNDFPVSHELTPFGAETSPVPGATRMRFAGHERDGLATPSRFDDFDSMHARFYAPGRGRFLSIDPVNDDIDPAKPQSWNKYAYVRNNPVHTIDPDGKAGWIVTAGGGALIGAGIQIAVNKWQGRDWDEGVLKAMAVGAAWGSGARLVGMGWAMVRGGSAAASAAASTQGAVVQGLYGTVARETLEAAASSGGSTVQVVTRLTQAPAVGRALSAAMGDDAVAVANAARQNGQLYSANLPRALLERMREAGLVVEKGVTMPGGARGIELRFQAAAAEFIVKYFKVIR